jgi:hypothetical protein
MIYFGDKDHLSIATLRIHIFHVIMPKDAEDRNIALILIEKDETGSMGLKIAKRGDSIYVIGCAERLQHSGIIIGDELRKVGDIPLHGRSLGEVASVMKSMVSPVSVELKHFEETNREEILMKVATLNEAKNKLFSAVSKVNAVRVFTDPPPPPPAPPESSIALESKYVSSFEWPHPHTEIEESSSQSPESASSKFLLEEEINRLRSEQTKAAVAYDVNTTKLKREHENEISHWKKLLAELEHQTSNHGDEKAKIQTNLQAARRQSVRMEMSNTDLERQVAVLQGENEIMHGKLIKVQRELAQEKEKYVFLEHEYELMKIFLTDLRKELHAVSSLKIGLHYDLASLQATIDPERQCSLILRSQGIAVEGKSACKLELHEKRSGGHDTTESREDNQRKSQMSWF